MKVGDLLKKATKLKKENKVEEAIQVLDEALPVEEFKAIDNAHLGIED